MRNKAVFTALILAVFCLACNQEPTNVVGGSETGNVSNSRGVS